MRDVNHKLVVMWATGRRNRHQYVSPDYWINVKVALMWWYQVQWRYFVFQYHYKTESGSGSQIWRSINSYFICCFPRKWRDRQIILINYFKLIIIFLQHPRTYSSCCQQLCMNKQNEKLFKFRFFVKAIWWKLLRSCERACSHMKMLLYAYFK